MIRPLRYFNIVLPVPTLARKAWGSNCRFADFTSPSFDPHAEILKTMCCGQYWPAGQFPRRENHPVRGRCPAACCAPAWSRGASHAQLSCITHRTAAERHRAPALSALPDPHDPAPHCARSSGLRLPHFRVPQMWPCPANFGGQRPHERRRERLASRPA